MKIETFVHIVFFGTAIPTTYAASVIHWGIALVVAAWFIGWYFLWHRANSKFDPPKPKVDGVERRAFFRSLVGR